MDLQRGFLISVTLSLLFITLQMLRPVLGYLLGTVMIAFVLYPLHRRMAPKIGPRVSAFTLIVFTLLAAIIPLGLAVNAVIDDARGLADNVNNTSVVETDDLERQIFKLTGQEIDIDSEIEGFINNLASQAIGGASRVIGIVTDVSIGISLSLFVLFYMLKDGKDFKAWLKETTPLPDHIQDKLYGKTYKTTWAVVKGHVLVAIAQGSIAGLGFLMVGIDNYMFWTFVMILLAFIPIVGAFLVWGPASLFLFMTGRPAQGMFLAIWGAVVVGFTDNFLRPILVERDADLHPAIILIGVIGGLYVFGSAGIFMGPIALGVLKSVLEVFRNNYDEL